MYIYEPVKRTLLGQLKLCKRIRASESNSDEKDDYYIHPQNTDYCYLSVLCTLSHLGLMTSRGLDADGDFLFSLTENQLNHLIEVFS